MLKDLIRLVVIFCHGSTCRELQVLLLPCYVLLIALLLLARCSIDMMVAGRGVVPVVESCSAAESLIKDRSWEANCAKDCPSAPSS